MYHYFLLLVSAAATGTRWFQPVHCQPSAAYIRERSWSDVRQLRFGRVNPHSPFSERHQSRRRLRPHGVETRLWDGHRCFQQQTAARYKTGLAARLENLENLGNLKQCQTDMLIFGTTYVTYLRSDTADNQYRCPILRILHLLWLQCKAPFTLRTAPYVDACTAKPYGRGRTLTQDTADPTLYATYRKCFQRSFELSEGAVRLPKLLCLSHQAVLFGTCQTVITTNS